MTTVTKKPDLQSIVYPYVISYQCECGKGIFFYSDKRPDKLAKCWNCL